MNHTEKPTVLAPVSKEYHETLSIIQKHGLKTVCEEASCPNVGECWKKKHASFIILGDICTRSCAFCHVKKGRPQKINEKEPYNIARAVKLLNLSHVVITSVTRDDLYDGGATQFAKVIDEIRSVSKNTTIEILTPDFKQKSKALDIILASIPDVFNHNLETVPRLYLNVRKGARYFGSLHLLHSVKEKNPKIFTKSGIMVGLGETEIEIYQVMDDLRAAGVDFLTIGQYLQPTSQHYPVQKYISLDEFENYAKKAKEKGFLFVASSPLTRSSYHADEALKSITTIQLM